MTIRDDIEQSVESAIEIIYADFSLGDPPWDGGSDLDKEATHTIENLVDLIQDKYEEVHGPIEIVDNC